MADTASVQIRAVTSAKGGVGKSTVCANLGMMLAMQGHRVLLIDCDTTNRCLDLMLGLEDTTIFGLPDILYDRCDVSRAIITCPTNPNLCLIPGGTANNGFMTAASEDEALRLADAFQKLLRFFTENAGTQTDPDQKDAFSFDYIFLDMPGGDQHLLLLTAPSIDEALIVSSAQATAVRSAEKTASMLATAGVGSQRLIINAFMGGDCFFPRRLSHYRQKKQNAAVNTLFSVVDSVALPLLGVIPFDASVWEAQNAGCLVNDIRFQNKPFAYAFCNIAARLNHKNVPLFSIIS